MDGRLQVFEPKDFPFFRGDGYLAFVIGRNGHVWGKLLDEQSSKGDVELRVYWPREDGCLVKMGDYSRAIPFGLMGALDNYLPLSQSQRDKIQSILSQKEVIQYELGTLMVAPGLQDGGFHAHPNYRRMTEKPKLEFGSPPCNIKVVDCLHGKEEWNGSMFNFWKIRYDDKNCCFMFSALSDMTSVIEKRKHVFPVDNILLAEVCNWKSENYARSVCLFYTTQLTNRKFNVSNWEPCRNRKLFKPELRIMYGENDFFEYFEIDDATLLLEELHEEHGVRFCWTLAIARNKHIREMMRLASNNPDLFAAITPKPKHIGGGGFDTF